MKTKGKLALHSTVLSGNIVLVQELLDGNVDVNQKDDNNNSSLHLAAIKGYAKIVRLLIDKGADVNSTNDHGSTPLHFAAQYNHTSVASLLIDNGAEVDIKNRYDDTALHFAISCSNVILIKKLIENRASVNSINISFANPLSIALKNKDHEIVSILKEAGASAPKGFFETMIISFQSANIFRKIAVISFLLILVSISAVATFITSGAIALSMICSIVASIGFAMICFEKPYHRVRDLEAKVLNGVMSQEEVDQLLFSKKLSIENKPVWDNQFVIKEPLNDNSLTQRDISKKTNDDQNKISS